MTQSHGSKAFSEMAGLPKGEKIEKPIVVHRRPSQRFRKFNGGNLLLIDDKLNVCYMNTSAEKMFDLEGIDYDEKHFLKI